MTTAIQGQTFQVLFALRDVLSPGIPLLNAFPGAVIPAGAIRIVKPGAAIANAAGTIYENGVGWYTYTGTAGESGLGLAAGAVGELGVHVDLAAAVGHQSFTIQVSSVAAGSLTAAERTAGAAAVAGAVPSLAQMQAGLPTDASIAAATAAAVGTRMLADGLTLEQSLLLCCAWVMGGGNFPMTPAGGAIIVRSADGSKIRISLTIDADGVRTVVAAPDVT